MRETLMGIGFRIRLSALALSENGDAKNWYRTSFIFQCFLSTKIGIKYIA